MNSSTSTSIVNCMPWHHYSIIKSIGLSDKSQRKLEAFRRKHERQGALVALLSWPDGIWCALAVEPLPMNAVVFSDEDKARAYRVAKAASENGYLPQLTMNRAVSP